MQRTTSQFLTVILVSTLLLAGLTAMAPRQEPSPASPQASGSDLFGYTWDDSAAFTWYDATQPGSSQASFPSNDDSFIGPVSLGFNFKFYENTYADLYISTNGLVSFARGAQSYINTPLPADTTPNNLIAAFWEDLVVGGDYNPTGKVYYVLVNDPGGRYFVIEWYQVVRRSEVTNAGANLLTFQMLLFENGNIEFRYQAAAGTSQPSVGMEDIHGRDGLQAPVPAAGLTNKRVRINRPAAGPRAKILPLVTSGLTQSHAADLSFEIINSGENGADIYDLFATPNDARWSVAFYAEDAVTPLADTDGDGTVDTGSISQGGSRQVVAKFRAQSSVDVGGHATASVIARSSLDPARQTETVITAAVPAPFALAYIDNQAGSHVRLVSDPRTTDVQVEPWFTGKSFALAQTARNAYFYVWERTYSKGEISYINLEYVVADQQGTLLRPISLLTNNQAATLSTIDTFPALAGAPNGRVGVVWVRDLSTIDLLTNSNVYFSVLDAGGAPLLAAPLNLTQNSEWSGYGIYDVPYFSYPRVLATADNRFIITWNGRRAHTTGESGDLYYAVFDSAGTLIKPASLLAITVPNVKKYLDINLTSLPGNRCLAAFAIQDLTTTEYRTTVAFMALDSSGGVVTPETTLAGSSGSSIDAALLANGKVLMSWVNYSVSRVGYAVLDGTTLAVVSAPQELATPKQRPAKNASVTRDAQGRGILTWADGWNDNLYYTLIDGQGTVITPPLTFYTIYNPPVGIVREVYAASTGLGIAPFEDNWQIVLPIIRRR